MSSRPVMPAILRVLLGIAVVAAAVVAIVAAWGEAGGAPLSTILGVVLFVVVFAAGGLAIRGSSRGIWWGALAVLWVVLLRSTESAEYLALPLIALAAATEPLMPVLFAAVAVVALASAIAATPAGIAAAGIFAAGVVVAVLAGLGYRRLAAPSSATQ
ncbi:hypothetical protein [Demequina sp. NBRC 110055]|uniref:hypothetical protein n=1 Tax=Demequina sp. NBRC 110055 TaxID=1570344 RepID=UPI0011853324|nr:hypothetical protein [Demequina sp. NBRC 110055]